MYKKLHITNMKITVKYSYSDYFVLLKLKIIKYFLFITWLIILRYEFKFAKLITNNETNLAFN